MQTVTCEQSITDNREDTPLRIRYRIRFAKTGLLRWISHRDLARLWERLVRRAELKLSMTEGFHPKPRIGFPSALALGVEGLDEVVELELAEDLTVDELFNRLCRDDQPGLKILSVVRLPDGFGKAQLLRSDYLIAIPETADLEQAQRAIEAFRSQTNVTLDRKKKSMTVKVASQVLGLEISDGQLHLSLAASKSATLRPSDILELIGAGDWIENGASIKRTRVVLQRECQSDEATNAKAETEQITETLTGDAMETSP